MDEAARVQVALVDDDPAPRVGVLDLERLDSEVARKLPGRKASALSRVIAELGCRWSSLIAA